MAIVIATTASKPTNRSLHGLLLVCVHAIWLMTVSGSFVDEKTVLTHFHQPETYGESFEELRKLYRGYNVHARHGFVPFKRDWTPRDMATDTETVEMDGHRNCSAGI